MRKIIVISWDNVENLEADDWQDIAEGEAIVCFPAWAENYMWASQEECGDHVPFHDVFRELSSGRVFCLKCRKEITASDPFDPRYSLNSTRYMDGTVEIKRGHEGEGERIPFRY